MNDKNLILRKQTLIDIADAIRAKTGSTELIKVEDLDDAVTNLQSGGSGDGVLIEYDAPGTVVPNSGYVEKVYLNTDLSESEVVGLLSQLTYNVGGYIYAVLPATSSPKSIVCMGQSGAYVIATGNNQGEIETYWCNETYFNMAGEEAGLTHSGWQEFDNPIEINAEISEAGSQNNLLTNLFSITPFGEKTTKTLLGTYDGSYIVANSNIIDMATLIDEKKIPLNIKFGKSITITADKYIPVNDVYCFPDGINCPAYDYDGDWSEFSEYLLQPGQTINFRASFVILSGINAIENPINITAPIIRYNCSVLIATEDNAFVTVRQDQS